jgi:hypothetical protein
VTVAEIGAIGAWREAFSLKVHPGEALHHSTIFRSVRYYNEVGEGLITQLLSMSK